MLALFQVLARFPEGWGQIKFLIDRLLDRQFASNRIQVTVMRIAYLMNQYPMVSHVFIRREILALERRGVEIMRIALRGWHGGSLTRKINSSANARAMSCAKACSALLWPSRVCCHSADAPDASIGAGVAHGPPSRTSAPRASGLLWQRLVKSSPGCAQRR